MPRVWHRARARTTRCAVVAQERVAAPGAGRRPGRGHGRGQRGWLTLGKRRAAGGEATGGVGTYGTARWRRRVHGRAGRRRGRTSARRRGRAAEVRSERRRRAASATARTRARARRRQPGGVVVCVSSSRDGGGGREPTRYMHKGHRSRAKPRPGTFESLFPGGNMAQDLCAH